EVPLYRRIYEMHKGQRLPEALGMQNLLHRTFQIPAGEACGVALRVLMESADQAGVFSATKGLRTNLIMPIIVDSAAGAMGGEPAGKGNSDEGSHENHGDGRGIRGGGGGSGDGPSIHPALRGLLTLIPEHPGPWSGRPAFDEAWKNAMEVLY